MIVASMDEEISLNNEEIEVLKLGPKFCLLKNLTEEGFEADLEEAIMKIKWDLMGEDDQEAPGLEDVALRVLLGDEVCNEADQQRAEEQEILEAESRAPFNPNDMTLNMARRRVTDLKGNSRVYFPRKARSLEEEASLETLRVELKALFKNYVNKFCKEGGSRIVTLPLARQGD